MLAIMAAHRVPYATTLSLAHRDDFLRKMRLALGMSGFRFLIMLSPCPAGWKSDPAQSVELVRLAVACGLFPLYEVFDGERYRINARPDDTPLEAYLSRQGRFRSVAPALDDLRAQVERDWARLEALERAFPAEKIDASDDTDARV
jgi:pyruvate ferredoxin oxidoreductase beta subunit/2-oxoisovalerate ferredoxin oxidoreductase beta subunit